MRLGKIGGNESTVACRSNLCVLCKRELNFLCVVGYDTETWLGLALVRLSQVMLGKIAGNESSATFTTDWCHM